MQHCMLDIETLGIGGRSVIASIGAVMFDKRGLGVSFHIRINIDSCLEKGLRVTGDTITWWMKQDPKAQEEVTGENRVTLPDALAQFSDWFKGNGGVFMWGNDPSFDNALVADAYAACNMQVPWKYNNNRCLRTLKALARDAGLAVNLLSDALHDPQALAHNALADATEEARIASELLSRMPCVSEEETFDGI